MDSITYQAASDAIVHGINVENLSVEQIKRGLDIVEGALDNIDVQVWDGTTWKKVVLPASTIFERATEALVELALEHPKSAAVLAVAGAVGIAYGAYKLIEAVAPTVVTSIGVASFSVQCAVEGGYTTVTGWFSSAKAA